MDNLWTASLPTRLTTGSTQLDSAFPHHAAPHYYNENLFKYFDNPEKIKPPEGGLVRQPAFCAVYNTALRNNVIGRAIPIAS